MIRTALAAGLAGACLSLVAGPATAVPRDVYHPTIDALQARDVAPPMPQVLRAAGGLSCEPLVDGVLRCSIDFRDARHGVDKFCSSVALRGIAGFRSCYLPRPGYHDGAARDVAEYRVPSHGRPPVRFGCSAAVPHVDGVVSSCSLNLRRRLDRFELTTYVNGRWQYAATWWPESGRVSRG